MHQFPEINTRKLQVLNEKGGSTVRGERAWIAVGVLLALPLSVQVGAGIELALGDREIRAAGGTYLPIFPPIGLLLAVFLLRRERRRRLRFVSPSQGWALALAAALVVPFLAALFVDQTYPIGAALPYLLQAVGPLLVLVYLCRVEPPAGAVAGLLGGLVSAVCAIALFVTVSGPYFDVNPAIGYADNFGVFGIPSSLRFFPTIVAVALVSGLIWSLGMRDSSKGLLLAIGIAASAGSLLLVAHSRTAPVAAVVALAAWWLIRGRRRASVLVAGLGLVVATFVSIPVLSSAPSVSRVIEGAGSYDDARIERVADSVLTSVHQPLGLRFEPTTAGRQTAGVELQRVVTAENQFGTYGASAGIAAFVLSIVFVLSLGRDTVRAIRFGGLPLQAAASGLLVLLLGTLLQNNLTHGHTALVALILSWIVVRGLRHFPSQPDQLTAGPIARGSPQ